MITDFNMRVSGIVAYSDGSKEGFSGTYNSDIGDTTSDAVAVAGNKGRDRDIGRHLMYPVAQRSAINAWLDLLAPADVSVYTAGSPTETANPDVFAKTVTSYDAHISGTIADDSGAVSTFDIEILPDGTIVDHVGNSGVAFDQLVTERANFPHYWSDGSASSGMLYYLLQRYALTAA